MSLSSFFKSEDIDDNEVPAEALFLMQTSFPNESFDTLARFLIAQNGDTDMAIEYLRNDITWREEFLPVSIESCLGELKKGKLYIHGNDCEGHPLFIWTSRYMDPKVRDISEQTLMLLWWTEVLMNHFMPNKKSKFTLLINRVGATLENVDIEFAKQFLPLVQDHYPERVHKVIVYPAGMLFYSIWGIVQWFVNPRTRNKVVAALNLETVQEYVPMEYIPTDMGGQCEYSYDLEEFLKFDEINKITQNTPDLTVTQINQEEIEELPSQQLEGVADDQSLSKNISEITERDTVKEDDADKN